MCIRDSAAPRRVRVDREARVERRPQREVLEAPQPRKPFKNKPPAALPAVRDRQGPAAHGARPKPLQQHSSQAAVAEQMAADREHGIRRQLEADGALEIVVLVARVEIPPPRRRPRPRLRERRAAAAHDLSLIHI